MKRGMTATEVLALPAMVGLVTAGRALKIGRTKSYELARTDAFPCRVLRVGDSYLVPTSGILAVLGLDPNGFENDPTP